MSQAQPTQEIVASLSSLPEATGARATDLLAWLTVERALYIGALLAGVFLRFWHLGAAPLDSLEVTNSWPAWLAATSRTVTDAPAPSSALLYGLQWLLFWIGADGDSAARAVTAAAGALLALLPWAWRGSIGRIAAVALAFLVALDPWLVAFSRLADGAILGIGLGMLALTAMLQLASLRRLPASSHEAAALHWRRVATAAIGLLLVSGVMAWPWLLVLAGFGWLQRMELRAAGLFESKSVWWVALAALLGGTMGLARLDALPLIGSSLGLWLAHIGGGGAMTGTSGEALHNAVGIGDYGGFWPWLRLIIDEPFLLVAGLAGLALAARRMTADRQSRNDAAPAPLLGSQQPGVSSRPRLHLLLVAWLGAGLLLWLFPGRSPYLLPIVGIPLMVFAATFIQALIRATPRDIAWREALAVMLTLAILVISGSFWAAALVSSRVYDPVMAQATAVIFALAFGIILAYALWSDRRHALWVAGAFVSIVLALLVIRSGWQLNQMVGPTALSGLFSRFTHPEVRLLVEDIETLSALRTGNPYELPIQVQVASQATDYLKLPPRPDPVLGWYLRAMRELAWVPAPSVDEPAGEVEAPRPLAVTLADAGSGVVEESSGDGDDDVRMRYNLPAEYAGSIYHVEAFWLPAMLLPPDMNAEAQPTTGLAAAWTEWVQPALRWLLYRKTPTLPPARDVVLWAPL